MNTLEKMYYGRIIPVENHIKTECEYNGLIKLLSRIDNELTQTFDEKQKDWFSKYKDCQDEIMEVIGRMNYTDGVSLGLNIMSDAINLRDEING